jgi:hypothetical protein
MLASEAASHGVNTPQKTQLGKPSTRGARSWEGGGRGVGGDANY